MHGTSLATVAVVIAAWCVAACSGELDNGQGGTSFGAGGGFGFGPVGPSQPNGVCLGATNIPHTDGSGSWCTAHYQYDSVGCRQVEGCRWTQTGAAPVSGYCSGQPVACSEYSEAQCASHLECDWYGLPRCSSDEACVRAWLVEDGWCSEIPDTLVASCSFRPRPVAFDFDYHCRGAERTVGLCD